MDLFELNEAFASQATYCAEKLQLDPEKVNVNGGAIALGQGLTLVHLSPQPESFPSQTD